MLWRISTYFVYECQKKKRSLNNCSFIPRHTAAPAANMGAIVQQHASAENRQIAVSRWAAGDRAGIFSIDEDAAWAQGMKWDLCQVTSGKFHRNVSDGKSLQRQKAPLSGLTRKWKAERIKDIHWVESLQACHSFWFSEEEENTPTCLTNNFISLLINTKFNNNNTEQTK